MDSFFLLKILDNNYDNNIIDIIKGRVKFRPWPD